jgi:hypothetical protein
MSETLQNLIDNYSTIEFDRIKFDWNGKHGDEFKDSNTKFRMEVINFIIPQISTVNVNLIRDLYIELSKFAKEAWGVSKGFNLLGQELLLRDYKKYLIDYMEGASQSMDTYLDSGRITLSTSLAKEILDYINNIRATETDERKKSLLDSDLFLDRFALLSQKEN